MIEFLIKISGGMNTKHIGISNILKLGFPMFHPPAIFLIRSNISINLIIKLTRSVILISKSYTISSK